MLTSSTLHFDGKTYTVLRSHPTKSDGLSPPIPVGCVHVIAEYQAVEKHGSHYLVGTFRPDGRQFGAVSRPPHSCCAWGEYENRPCVHQNWRP